jgi:exopolyphosphatase/guanosine-5'-triphosphate,3'-diphosphate pyrophosphatase
MRCACVDIGTNTTRLLVAEREDGEVVELERRTTITSLGQGVDATGRLADEAMDRVAEAIAVYREVIDRLCAEQVVAVATSAMRDAENGPAFRDYLKEKYGVDARTISGDEEARLTFLGATAGRNDDRETVVIDIGGGSTELIEGGERVSTELGSVRLTERFLESDPPTAGEVEELARAVRSVLEEHDLSPKRGIGVAGTVTSLAALDLELVEYDPDRVHRHRLGQDAVRAQLERLAALPLAERREVPGLEPERAPVIVAGAAILLEVMRHLGLPEIEVSERDLLDGAALEAAALPEPVEGDAPPGAYTCC